MSSDERLLRIEDKLDKLVEKLGDTNIILAENTQSLIIHEKRTDIAEQKLNLLEVHFQKHTASDEIILQGIHDKLDPVHKHVTVVNAMFKITAKYVIPTCVAVIGILFKFGILKPIF